MRLAPTVSMQLEGLTKSEVGWRRTRHSSGTGRRWLPLSNRRSFSSVSSAFRMALLALKISSMNAISAVGRYPSVLRTYWSSSSPVKT